MQKFMPICGWLSLMLLMAMTVRNCDFAGESVEGEASIYAYESWVPLVALFGGIVFSIWVYRSAVPAIWSGYGRYDVGPWGASLFGILTVGLALDLYCQSIEVDAEQIVVKGRFSEGAWFLTEDTIQFASVKRIRVLPKEGGGRSRGEWCDNCLLHIEQVGGKDTVISASNDVARLAATRILETASQLKIPVSSLQAN